MQSTALIPLIFAFVVIVSGTTTGTAKDPEPRPLFNGKDLSGWDGNPDLWSVEDGCITGVTQGPEQLSYNQFLIWRGGVLKNFQLTAKIKQSGNNTGIQYRSQELPEVGKWSIGGYQCDVHPTAANNAMLYEERGRAIVAANGQSVLVDPQGTKWLTDQRPAIAAEVAQWNEYSIIAQGNHLIHKLNGNVTAEVHDFDEASQSFRGLLAFQIHRGPAMRVQIKDVMLVELPDSTAPVFDASLIPEGAKKIEKPVAGEKKAKKVGAK